MLIKRKKKTKQNHDAKQQTHKLVRGQFSLPFWFDMTRVTFMFYVLRIANGITNCISTSTYKCTILYIAYFNISLLLHVSA
jgi:hypothetical protein